jgi:hypothetical protein
LPNLCQTPASQGYHEDFNPGDNIDMRIVVDAQVQWHFFTVLYPLFKHALPRIERLSNEDQRNLRIQNAITTIRHNILAIPLQLQQVQLNQDLKEADFSTFLEALLSLLKVFERLVEEDMRQHADDACSYTAPQQVRSTGMTRGNQLRQAFCTHNQLQLLITSAIKRCTPIRYYGGVKRVASIICQSDIN